MEHSSIASVIVETSPDERYIRYDELLEEEDRSDGELVFKGFDEDYGMDIAWKKIRVDDRSKAEQLIENLNDFVKKLKHKNIVNYYGSWVDHETKHINIIMECFSSGCLRKYRKKHKSLETNVIKKWARQILEGLCYLHTYDPPIVHGRLSCGNIFINGNTGEVKIGDPGLGNILEDLPFKVYEEEKNHEYFDLYLFGMCMLELAAPHTPSYEFENLEKMDSSKILIALENVKDEQFKKFIGKCLFMECEKSSAKELLRDSFLQTPNATTIRSDEVPLASVFKIKRIIGKSEFRLKGERKENNCLIFFKLYVNNLNGQKLNVEFEFDPRTETSIKVAAEMVDALELQNEDVLLVADLMDSLIFRLVPSWMSPTSKTGGVKCANVDLISAF